jgi:AhpC/TSA family
MPPDRPSLLPALVVAVCTILAHSASSQPLAAPSETNPPSSASRIETGRKALTLEAWRKLKKEADDIAEVSQGPERIARCQAFLKSHPEYPDPYSILMLIVQDLAEVPDADPAYVAGVLEQLHKLRPDADGSSGLYLVENYLLGFQPVPEGVDRLLERSREAIERSRALPQEERDPVMRWRPSPDALEFRVLLAEGRILLSRGDATGALKKLREAEEKGISSGQFLLLRDGQGNPKVLLPGSYSQDWLNLSMAEAYARLGDKGAARDHLKRVVGSLGSNVEFVARLEKLRTNLGVPPPEKTEVRIDPAPAPDFNLEDLDGKKVSLTDYRGQVVLVMLWATW